MLDPAIKIEIADIGDADALRRICREFSVSAVAHFAGKIQVGESVREPEIYFDVNVARTLSLLGVVRELGSRSFLFSSTAAVYGDPETVPIPERAIRQPVNPYGATKLTIEHALDAWGQAYGVCWAALRYFN